MLSRAVVRAAPRVPATASRAFHSTPARFSSPYHYPDGPLSNLPFNPRTKYFAVRYWTTMAVGFSTPILLAGA